MATREEERRRRLGRPPGTQQPTKVDFERAGKLAGAVTDRLGEGVSRFGKLALRGMEDFGKARSPRALGRAAGDVAIGVGGTVLRPAYNFLAGAGGAVKDTVTAVGRLAGGFFGIGDDDAGRPPDKPGNEGNTTDIPPNASISTRAAGGPGTSSPDRLPEVFDPNNPDIPQPGGARAIPASVGTAAADSVRERAPRPPAEPEFTEVIRGSQRSIQDFGPGGSSRGIAEFQSRPGLSVSESREAAPFGDPAFQAQQDQRVADLGAQSTARTSRASLINAVSDSKNLTVAEDGTVSATFRDPDTGELTEVVGSQFMAELLVDPDEFEIVNVNEGVIGSTPRYAAINKSDPTDVRQIDLRSDLQIIIQTQLDDKLQSGDSREDALDDLADDYPDIDLRFLQ